MLEGNAVNVFVAVLVVTGVIVLLKRNGKKKTGKPYPPSLPALPFVGSLPFVSGDTDALSEIMKRNAEKLGPVFSFYAGRKLAIVLNGKNAFVDALQKHAEAFADRPGLWTEANILNVERRGIAFAHYNDTFKRYHKLSLAIMKELGFGTSANTDVRIWDEVEPWIKEISTFNGRQFDPRTISISATTNVVVRALFGKELDGNCLRQIIENAHEYEENFDPAIDMAPIIRFLPMYRSKIANMIRCKEGLILGLEEAISHNKLNDHENSFVKRFLEMEGVNYDHQDLLYILRDMCLASSDSLGSTLLWALVELANHPQIQSRLQKEIDEVVLENRLPSIEDKTRLPLTEATLMEIMRYHTVAYFGLPHATLKDTEVCGYFVPKDCLVIPNIYSVHMDKTIWKNPENFRPDRFLDVDNKVIGKDNIMPFGIGKRACIGEGIARHTVFVFFASLIQHFEIRPPEGQDSIDVRNHCGLVASPKDFEVRLIPRKRNVII